MEECDNVEEGRNLVFFNAMRHELAKLKVQLTIEIANDIIEADEPVAIFRNYNAVVDEIINAFGDKAVK